MLGDLIDLATPTGTPFCPNDSKEPQLPQVNADEDVFEFAKLPDQNSPQGTLLTPPFHTKNNWVTDDEAVYSEAGKYKLDVDHGGKDTRAGVDQLTPRLCADTAPMELECPPTCPLQIPPTPALTPTPAPAAAVNLASSHRNAMTLPAFDTAALAAAASEERAAAPAEADCETTCMQLETLETSSAAGSRSVRGAVASEEEPCPSSSREGVLATEKELEELKAKLAKVEASRDSIARDLGHQKGSLAKLEGTVSSLDKRLKIQVQENQALKARLADAERAAAVASVAADVTPDRCRSSVRAMHEEALRWGRPVKATMEGGGRAVFGCLTARGAGLAASGGEGVLLLLLLLLLRGLLRGLLLGSRGHAGQALRALQEGMHATKGMRLRQGAECCTATGCLREQPLIEP